MGIMSAPSLNSAILYNVSLYFHFKDPSTTLKMSVIGCRVKRSQDISTNRANI